MVECAEVQPSSETVLKLGKYLKETVYFKLSLNIHTFPQNVHSNFTRRFQGFSKFIC